ncbi:C (U2) putative protein [Ouango virus]|uniref:Uncharacterized protein n=1 Tax=Ouango virus TaxID=864692 RepID=A0AAE8XBM9_9RHAB|nr:C (U2) putative protein [Ouango virus]UAU42889.1 C (U2) putative protein [Ouango virus]
MSRIPKDVVIQILEECSDLNCQEHRQELHIKNLFRWFWVMVNLVRNKMYQVYHGIQHRLAMMILSTREGNQAAINLVKNQVMKKTQSAFLEE